MKITAEQLSKLGTFRCERLAASPENIRLVINFENYKNESLTHTLQDEAYHEDEENTVAYYIVKSEDDDIVFYFSLKCGLLYDDFLEGERLKKMKQVYLLILELSKDDSKSEEEKLVLATLLENIRTKKGVKQNEVERILGSTHDSLNLSELFAPNQKHVGRTFAGLEIVHFCANDSCRHVWDKCEFPQKMGTIIFWQFIVPKILELMDIAGCEYLFLFAADSSEYSTLVNYYCDQLGFEVMDNHSAATPIYDFTCQFLCQRTAGLKDARDKFFNDFNVEDPV